MIQKYWGQPGCLCLHYIKRTNDGAPLPDSSAIFQRMKKGLCTNAYFSLTRQPLRFCPFGLLISFAYWHYSIFLNACQIYACKHISPFSNNFILTHSGMLHYGDTAFLCPSTQTGNPYWFPEQLQAALPALHWLLLIPQMSYLIVLLPVC